MPGGGGGGGGGRNGRRVGYSYHEVAVSVHVHVIYTQRAEGPRLCKSHRDQHRVM